MVYLVIGLAAGLCSGLFGIGGGILIVPALILISGFKPQAATGTSLGALLLPVGALGAWRYWKHGDVNIGASLLIALGLFLGAYFGAGFGLPLSPRVLQRSFAVFLVAVAAMTWWRS